MKNKNSLTIQPLVRLPYMMMNLILFLLLMCFFNYLNNYFSAAMLDLFVRILEKLFVEEMYPARSAGLNLHLYPSDRGLMVEFSGFNQKIPVNSHRNFLSNSSNLVNLLFKIFSS